MQNYMNHKATSVPPEAADRISHLAGMVLFTGLMNSSVMTNPKTSQNKLGCQDNMIPTIQKNYHSMNRYSMNTLCLIINLIKAAAIRLTTGRQLML